MTDIERIREARHKLESDIRESVTKAISEFKAKTGACPSDITIELMRVDRLGYCIEEHIVGRVSATIRV